MRQHAMQYLCVALTDEQKWWVLVRRVPQHHGHSSVAPSVETTVKHINQFVYGGIKAGVHPQLIANNSAPVAPSVEKSGGPTNLWGLNVPLNRAK